jgi:hypothetical protein
VLVVWVLVERVDGLLDELGERERPEQCAHPLGALGEQLVGVPGGLGHDREHSGDERVGDLFVKQVRHAVDEHQPWSTPPQRQCESLWPDP